MLNLSFSTIRLWALRAAIAVLAACLWAANGHIDTLEETIRAKDRAALEALANARRENNEKLSQATGDLLDQLNRANNLARDRGAELERVRNANTRLQSRAKADTATADRQALARCSELLAEGAGLATEGEGLLLRHGAEHDALVDVVK